MIVVVFNLDIVEFLSFSPWGFDLGRDVIKDGVGLAFLLRDFIDLRAV